MSAQSIVNLPLLSWKKRGKKRKGILPDYLHVALKCHPN